MYRRETKEKAAYAGNRTRRTDSVKQHEMAALREMEQMVLAAENSEGTAAFWMRNSVPWRRSGESLRTARPGAMAFCGTWLGLAADGRWQIWIAAESGTIPS